MIYLHGGAWRYGTKDMRTRTFFRRLTAQGHVVLDLAYRLAPLASVPEMASDVKQGIIWLKEHASEYGVEPDKVVLMGGSAGGHLALLAAYTPDHPAFQPDDLEKDTSVRAVVAFYPPTDLGALERGIRDQALEQGVSRPVWR